MASLAAVVTPFADQKQPRPSARLATLDAPTRASCCLCKPCDTLSDTYTNVRATAEERLKRSSNAGVLVLRAKEGCYLLSKVQASVLHCACTEHAHAFHRNTCV